VRRRKQVWYFYLAMIEQDRVPLSPHELEVRERLTYEQKEQLLAKLDLGRPSRPSPPSRKPAFSCTRTA
jgi:hypothetical protein